MDVTRTVEIAIPSFWWQHKDFLEIFFYGLLCRSLPGTTIAISAIQDDNYNGVGVMRCDAVIATACDVASARINEAMRLNDPTDPFAKMRDFASEDQADKSEIEKLVADFLKERDRPA